VSPANNTVWNAEARGESCI